MISRTNNERGFTIVELLIVIVVIGILAGLVLNTFSGIQQRARDSERQTDVNNLHTQLEAYHADNGIYPSATDFASTSWTSTNLPGLDAEALVDPTAGGYTYTTTPAACDNTAGNECTSYVLSADLESDGRAGDDDDGNTVDYDRPSLN